VLELVTVVLTNPCLPVFTSIQGRALKALISSVVKALASNSFSEKTQSKAKTRKKLASLAL